MEIPFVQTLPMNPFSANVGPPPAAPLLLPPGPHTPLSPQMPYSPASPLHTPSYPPAPIPPSGPSSQAPLPGGKKGKTLFPTVVHYLQLLKNSIN